MPSLVDGDVAFLALPGGPKFNDFMATLSELSDGDDANQPLQKAVIAYVAVTAQEEEGISKFAMLRPSQVSSLSTSIKVKKGFSSVDSSSYEVRLEPKNRSKGR